MNEYERHIKAVLGAWNTTSATEQADIAAKSLEHNLHFVDPNHNIIGRQAFLDMVKVVQARLPGAVYSHESEIGFQNNFCRYHWAIRVKGETVMTGFDVTEVNDAGRLVKIIGFFGELERAAP